MKTIIEGNKQAISIIATESGDWKTGRNNYFTGKITEKKTDRIIDYTIPDADISYNSETNLTTFTLNLERDDTLLVVDTKLICDITSIKNDDTNDEVMVWKEYVNFVLSVRRNSDGVPASISSAIVVDTSELEGDGLIKSDGTALSVAETNDLLGIDPPDRYYLMHISSEGGSSPKYRVFHNSLGFTPEWHIDATGLLYFAFPTDYIGMLGEYTGKPIDGRNTMLKITMNALDTWHVKKVFGVISTGNALFGFLDVSNNYCSHLDVSGLLAGANYIIEISTYLDRDADSYKITPIED